MAEGYATAASVRDAVAALVTATAEALANVVATPDRGAVHTPAVSGADVGLTSADPRPEPEPEGSTAAHTAKLRQAGKAGAQANENNVVPLHQRAAKNSGAGGDAGDAGGAGGGDDGGESGGGDEEPDAFDPFHLSAEGVFFSARNADDSERKPEWVDVQEAFQAVLAASRNAGRSDQHTVAEVRTLLAGPGAGQQSLAKILVRELAG